MKKISKKSIKNIGNVDSRIIELINRVINKYDHSISIPQYGGMRTPQEQNNLYHDKNHPEYIDGFKNISPYQVGLAWSIYLEDKERLYEVSSIFKEEFKNMKQEDIFKKGEEIIWGGDLIRHKKNMTHYEIF